MQYDHGMAHNLNLSLTLGLVGWVGRNKEIEMINRSEVSRALAKAIAFKQCGKEAEAQEWARKLVRQLELAEILR